MFPHLGTRNTRAGGGSDEVSLSDHTRCPSGRKGETTFESIIQAEGVSDLAGRLENRLELADAMPVAGAVADETDLRAHALYERLSGTGDQRVELAARQLGTWGVLDSDRS